RPTPGIMIQTSTEAVPIHTMSPCSNCSLRSTLKTSPPVPVPVNPESDIVVITKNDSWIEEEEEEEGEKKKKEKKKEGKVAEEGLGKMEGYGSHISIYTCTCSLQVYLHMQMMNGYNRNVVCLRFKSLISKLLSTIVHWLDSQYQGIFFIDHIIK
ncbi:hypothetical protein PP707_08095, partial [Acetobacter pasteurianus]|nr:hypothetical protein [Acetobacter pasteurianus]